MRTVYIDSDFKGHVKNDGTMRSVETDFFDGKCDALVECYRIVPEGENWMREDGTVFTGMVAPWKPLDEANLAQREYERQLLAEYKEALRTVGVNV